jgi:aminoglycoside phosphotransferase (APT) family kinase protein
MREDQLEKIIAQAMDLPRASILVRLRPPLDVQSNRLYDVWAGDRHLIAKEFLKPAEFQDAPRREFNALERLAPFDVAPQPVFYKSVDPDSRPELGPVVIYQFMAGKAWDRRKPSSSDLGQLADLWLQVNALSGDDLWLSRGYDRPLHESETRFAALFQAYAAWAGAEYPPGRQAIALCLKQLEKAHSAIDELATYDPPLCFCRSDPRFANVIARPDGRLGMVDWEDSGLRDPARDLADVVTHPNQEDLLTWDEWQPFLQNYIAERNQVDPHLERRMHLYLAIFPIFWLAMAIQGGLRRAKEGGLLNVQVNRLPINERMRRNLARAMAWPTLDFSAQLDELASLSFFPTVQAI